MSLEYTNITTSADIKIDEQQVISIFCSGNSNTDLNKNISITIVNNDLFQANKKVCVQDIHKFIDSTFGESE